MPSAKKLLLAAGGPSLPQIVAVGTGRDTPALAAGDLLMILANATSAGGAAAPSGFIRAAFAGGSADAAGDQSRLIAVHYRFATQAEAAGRLGAGIESWLVIKRAQSIGNVGARSIPTSQYGLVTSAPFASLIRADRRSLVLGFVYGGNVLQNAPAGISILSPGNVIAHMRQGARFGPYSLTFSSPQPDINIVVEVAP